MGRAYDMGIETNHDAWRAVHEGLSDGLSMIEISERTGISYQMVGVYGRMDHPASIVRKIQRNAGGPNYGTCGHVVAWSTAGGGKCDRCSRRELRAQAGTAGRIENLRSWALRHGRVPTITEARDILGISRSRAGDLIIEAFGRDQRRGAQLRTSYRGWPEGAPDVPRPDQVEALREHGRATGRSNLMRGRGAR